MIIRSFEPDDFEGVLEIELDAFSEHNPLIYMNFYEMNRNGFLIAMEDGVVLGFVVGYRSCEKEGRIFSLAVRDVYRGQGIGRQLLQTILEVFYENGFQYATLEVRASNKNAQRLYSKIGFVPCWIEQGYYSDGENAIIMKTRLSPERFQNCFQKYSAVTRPMPGFDIPDAI
jgi:ribosomal-protein-alanine N-acetyltransferase